MQDLLTAIGGMETRLRRPFRHLIPAMLVSAIMPTRDRRHLLPLALRSFLAQDWPDLELVVVDDSEHDNISADLFHALPGVRVRYQHLGERFTIGNKLNQACQIADGDILIRWDDDDWSAPGRVSDQVNRLLAANAKVSGYCAMVFYDPKRRQATKYNGAVNFYSLGTGLCFTRDYWLRNPFPDKSMGEDNDFITLSQQEKSIVSVDAGELMVALLHDRNTSSRASREGWPVVEAPAAFLSDLRAVRL